MTLMVKEVILVLKEENKENRTFTGVVDSSTLYEDIKNEIFDNNLVDEYNFLSFYINDQRRQLYDFVEPDINKTNEITVVIKPGRVSLSSTPAEFFGVKGKMRIVNKVNYASLKNGEDIPPIECEYYDSYDFLVSKFFLVKKEFKRESETSTEFITEDLPSETKDYEHFKINVIYQGENRELQTFKDFIEYKDSPIKIKDIKKSIFQMFNLPFKQNIKIYSINLSHQKTELNDESNLKESITFKVNGKEVITPLLVEPDEEQKSDIIDPFRRRKEAIVFREIQNSDINIKKEELNQLCKMLNQKDDKKWKDGCIDTCFSFFGDKVDVIAQTLYNGEC